MPTPAEWNERYTIPPIEPPQPCTVLRTYSHLLPTTGLALDVAAGLGGNALWLAQHGLTTHAWDYSSVGLEQLQLFAQKQGVSIQTTLRDVILQPPEPASFDIIVVSHFLERTLANPLINALKENGLLFYQTFTRSGTEHAKKPRNPAYCLAENELLHLFQPLRLIAYREEGALGNITGGFRDEAWLIGQRHHKQPN